MGYLYRHIRLDTNQPFYIGASNEGGGLANLYRRAYSKLSRNKEWKKIAANGYEVEIIIHDIPDEQLAAKEVEFIRLYGKISDGGTLINISSGGNKIRSKFSKYVYERDPNPPKVIKRDFMRGKRHSEETKLKMRLRKKEMGNPMTGKFGYAPHSKKIVQIDITTDEIIAEYPSINYAASVNKFSCGHLNVAVSGRYGHNRAYGFKWEVKK